VENHLEVVFAVIDCDVGTEAFHEIEIRRAGRGRYEGDEMFGELNGKGTNASRARVNQNLLPFLQIRFFDQRLPRRLANERN
jgi:hypothetical protein